ncbi:PREDICTED: 39S ribosomal protein L28, mitochondrial [Prunus mume]|uniref:39S ribosomal protein L28, mitochondrial n=1 Tax=Prunus mume TaxID=102107 RepID=A0ABM0N5Q8_PRUMU|nr:PREDICTED: 39S ribosomal protein L28, mitochondrial [Prunus mume]
MALKGKETIKSMMRKFGDKALTPRLKEEVKKKGIMGDKTLPPRLREELKKQGVPNSKIIMGRAKRGIYAGRHIQFGNQISEDGGNKSRRTWKPNVQEKRLFSYILDRHIRVKVSTHALRCIDKAGGIDEYFLKTPYQRMDTEMGLVWKAKIEKLYEEVGQTPVALIKPEAEANLEQKFKQLKLDERDVRREMYGWSNKLKQIEEGANNQVADEEGARIGEQSSHVDVPEQLVANS